MSRFLVTGGAGFIGSHIAQRLLAGGHYVRILDNFSSGKRENLAGFIDKVDLAVGDIRSEDTCAKAAEGIDFVFHEAALRSVPGSMQRPAEYNETNIGGILNMLRASLNAKVKRFVFASSSSVYGDVKSFPEKESSLPLPISPYALTKVAGEYYCKIFSLHYGLSTVALRYFNVFGPRQALDDEYAVVIPKFITCMLKDEPPPVFGTGKQCRDFAYIDNVVNANLLAVEKDGLSGDVFNVAGGRSYTVLELVGLINKILGKNIKPRFLELRAGDVFKTLADLSLAKKKLGYRPLVGFEEGLSETIKFFKGK